MHKDLNIFFISGQCPLSIYPENTTSGFLMFRGGYLKENSLKCVNVDIKLKPYSPNVIFLYPLKKLDNLWFSVFRGYRNVTLGEYGLIWVNKTNTLF